MTFEEWAKNYPLDKDLYEYRVAQAAWNAGHAEGVQAERERAAKIAETFFKDARTRGHFVDAQKMIADAIRTPSGGSR